MCEKVCEGMGPRITGLRASDKELRDEIRALRTQVSALQTEADEAKRRCAIAETVLKNGAEGLWELADYRADNLSLNEGLRESAAARRKLEAELAEEKRLHKHWKDQHANEVRRARILKDTTDLPLERVRAYELMGELQGQIAKLQAEKEDMRQHCIHCIDEPEGVLCSTVTMLENAEADRNKLCEALDILMEHVDKYGNSAFQTQWKMARQVASILAETTIYAERPMKWGHLQRGK